MGILKNTTKAIEWLLGDDTGMSSKCICSVMLLGKMIPVNSVPSDADDFGRCYRLLQLIPEWENRLDQLKKFDYSVEVNMGEWTEDDKWSCFVNNYDKWKALYESSKHKELTLTMYKDYKNNSRGE